MTQADERRALISKLSVMHDQFAHCMGRHPELLMLTPYSAGVLEWKVGDATPFYAEIGSVTEIRDYFDGGNAGPGYAASRSDTSLPSLFKAEHLALASLPIANFENTQIYETRKQHREHRGQRLPGATCSSFFSAV